MYYFVGLSLLAGACNLGMKQAHTAVVRNIMAMSEGAPKNGADDGSTEKAAGNFRL